MPTGKTARESIDARVAAVALVLQGLLNRLLMAGAITPDDLEAIRALAGGVAEDLQAEDDADLGKAVAREVESLLWALGTDREAETH